MAASKPTLPPQTALVTQSIYNLVGGVSQKAASQRRSTQTEEIINGLLSPSEGLKKRPQTNLTHHFTARPSDTTLAPGEVFTHIINRSDTEQYAVSCMDGDLRVIDIQTGVAKTVTFPDGKGYINSTTPGTDYRAVTVGDYTFIINRTKTVASLSSPLSPTTPHEALVWVQVGDYGVPYTIVLNGTNIIFPADPTNRDEVTTDYIAKALFSRIPRGCYFTIFDLGTSPYIIGETVTITPTTPGGLSAVTYVVQAGADGNVESRHSIARGLAAAINAASYGFLSGNHVVATATDDPQLFGPGGGGLFVVGMTTADIYDYTITSSGTGGPGKYTAAADHLYDCQLNGSTIYIVKADASDFTITCHDGLGDESLKAIKGQVQSFGDLPSRAKNGMLVEVTGDNRALTDSFFVKYEDSATAGTAGVWRESLKGGERTSLDPATMPHILVRQSDGTFIFSEADWDPRLVGKLATGNAPMPSFVGKKLNDISFYKNRLVLQSEEDDTACSSVGNAFNFFRLSVQQLLDDDVIDVSINVLDGRSINHLVPFDKDLILFGDKQQFLFGSGDKVLTPVSVAAPAITAFDNSPAVKPVQIGKDMFFLVDRTTSTQMMEFYRDQNGNTNDAQDLSKDIPSYCVGQPLDLSGSEASALLIALTKSNTSDAYVYNYEWQGNTGLSQSAWSTWRFHGGVVLTVDQLKNRVILTIQRGTQIFLETMLIKPADVDTGVTALTLLDLRMSEADCTSVVYSGGTTIWTMPFDVPNDSSHPLKVFRKTLSGGSAVLGSGVFIRPALNKIAVTGDFTTVPVWIGLQYDHTATLSTLYERDNQDNAAGQLDVETQLKRLYVNYTKTGYLDVLVTPTGRSTAYINNVTSAAGTASGLLTVPVMANNNRVTIQLSNPSEKPSSVLGLTWTAMISQKTRR